MKLKDIEKFKEFLDRKKLIIDLVKEFIKLCKLI
jgi:hypothetical protein